MMSTIKDTVKSQLVGWVKWLGIEVLNREQSGAFLADYLIATNPGDRVMLPAVDDFTDPDKRIFDTTGAIAEPGYVWSYESRRKKPALLRCGALFSEGNVLCMDWIGNRRLLGNGLNPRKRVLHEADTLIAPWSHYLDGIRFGGYYDYVILIAAKLCRIKEALPENVFNRAAVAYPLFGTAYERELLALIGVGADRIFDSRLTNIRFKTCVLGNSGHWFYPNVADLMALKRQVESQLPAVSREPDRANPGQSRLGQSRPGRVYISRSGRRRILNEDALIALLEKYNIEFIEDKPRTIAEQVAIYQNASFIIGPHGASFTNILWCRPGAHLVELFSPNYVPDFFLYMAQRLGLRYSAYFCGPESSNRFGGLDEDIVVSIPDLERSLAALFAVETSV